MSVRRTSRSRDRGFTMVEILIVVALIALLSGMIIGGSGLLASNRLRAASAQIIGGVKQGIIRANQTGNPARLVFDIEENRLTLEETSGRMLRVVNEEEGANVGAEAATDAEVAAQEYAKRIMDGPRAPRARFTEFKKLGCDESEEEKGCSLGRGIRFIQIHTEHDVEPRVDGKAYLYFWPGGGTERAVIQLTKSGDSEGISILVSGLTGRAVVERGRVDFEQDRIDPKFGEREEEF